MVTETPVSESLWSNPNWWVAWGTVALVVATALLFVATFGLYLAALATLKHAQRDAKTSRDQGRELFFIAQRPWIQVSAELNGAIRRDEEKSSVLMDVEFTVRNVGNSPAFNIRVEPRVLALEMQTRVDELQQEMREQVRRKKEAAGYTLFPTDEHSRLYAISISREEIEAVEQHMRASVPDLNGAKLLVGICPLIYGSARYQTNLDDAVHQSGFIFRIGMGRSVRVEGADTRYIPLTFFPAHGVEAGKAHLFRDERGFWAD